jgi:arabinogalactan oligomer/maltooligosaccharide transport system substrate-binding protein
MKRKILSLLLVALVVLGSVSVVMAQDTEIIYWDTMGDSERAVFEEIVNACETQLGIAVDYQYVPFSEAQQNYRTAAQGGAAPDVMRTEVAWTAEFAAAGYLLDLTDQITDEERASYAEAPFNYNVYGGKIWGLPQVTDAPALYYNKALYEAAGLDPEAPPTSMDELKEHALAISALSTDEQPLVGLAPVQGAYFFQPFMWAFGGGLIDTSGDEPVILINSQGTYDAFAFLQDLRDSGAMGAEYDPANQYTNSLTAFKEGAAGMLVNGPWESTNILTTGPAFVDTPEALGVAPVPPGPEGQGSPVGGHGYTIYGGTPYPEESLAFVRCLNQPENQLRLATDLNLVPTLLEVYDAPELQENAVLQGFFAQMRVATNRPVIVAGGQIYTEFGPRFDAVTLGNEEPEEAMDTVAEAWSLLLEQEPSAE